MGFFYTGEIYFMMNLEEIKEKWEKKTKDNRGYKHFDCKKNSQSLKLQKYITNPLKIAKHSFYPFLHHTIIMKKFDKNSLRKIKKKTREINYSAHIDRLIFSYYLNSTPLVPPIKTSFQGTTSRDSIPAAVILRITFILYQ